MERYESDNPTDCAWSTFRSGVRSSARPSCWSVIKDAPYAHKYYSSKKRTDAAMEFARTHRFRYDIKASLRREQVAII